MAELKALLENRKEHVQYLQDVLLEPILDEFSDIYQSVTTKSKILQEFQTELGKIPEWNHVMITAAYERVLKRSGCKFLPDLLRAIFTTSVKCHLMTHGKMDAMSTIKFRVPTTEKFIHRLLIACAQEIWKQPYLLYHAVRSIERQYNRGKVEDIIRKQVEGTIRSCLPMEQIVSLIHDNMEEAASSSSSSESEVTETSSEESSDTEETESLEEEASDVEIERIVVEDEESDDEEKVDEEVVHSDSAESEESDKNADDAESVDYEPVDVVVHVPEENVVSERGGQEDKTEHDVVEPMKDMHEEVVVLAPEAKNEDSEEEHQENIEQPREIEPAVQYFDDLVKALENEPEVMVSDASPQRKSIEIHTSSSSEDESDGEAEAAIPSDDRKVIPLKNLLINERKFHRPKMASRTKRSDRVTDAFY
jgi:hypothetical protein